MITACFDGAGKWEDAKTPIVAVVGFCSMARVWADFEREWLKVLKDFSIPYFHPLLFAHSYEHFKSFKDDEEKRRNLVSGLLDVIASCGLRKFGAFIKKKDLEKAKYAMGLNGDVTVDAFVLCARSAVDDLYAYAKNEGITKNIRTVFDKGDSEDLLKKHFDLHGFPDPDFAWSKRVIKKGREQPFFVGLQAAGWIAWEYYLDACRVSGVVDRPPTADGRFAFRAFEGMPGHLKIPFMSNPSEDLIKRIMMKP